MRYHEIDRRADDSDTEEHDRLTRADRTRPEIRRSQKGPAGFV